MYQILKNYVIFLDKAELMPNSKAVFHAVNGYLIHLGVEVDELRNYKQNLTIHSFQFLIL